MGKEIKAHTRVMPDKEEEAVKAPKKGLPPLKKVTKGKATIDSFWEDK